MSASSTLTEFWGSSDSTKVCILLKIQKKIRRIFDAFFQIFEMFKVKFIQPITLHLHYISYKQLSFSYFLSRAQKTAWLKIQHWKFSPCTCVVDAGYYSHILKVFSLPQELPDSLKMPFWTFLTETYVSLKFLHVSNLPRFGTYPARTHEQVLLSSHTTRSSNCYSTSGVVSFLSISPKRSTSFPAES